MNQSTSKKPYVPLYQKYPSSLINSSLQSRPSQTRIFHRSRRSCICNMPDWGDSFLICCEICSHWFHPACVGHTEADCRSMETFICPWCSSSDPLSLGAAALRRYRKPLPDRCPGNRICICQKRDNCIDPVVWCGDCEDLLHPQCIALDTGTLSQRHQIPIVICPPCRNYRKHMAGGC